MVSLRAVRFAWPGQDPLWSGLDADLTGGLWAVVGDEGRGKTTLLRLLAGELEPQGGEIRLYGRPCTSAERAASTAWTDPRTSAHDGQVVRAYLAEWTRRHPATDTERLAAMVDALSLTEHLDKTFAMLSTGSRRKVWIAAALASGAPVVLLDQPFAALDAPSARHVAALLAHAAQTPDRLVVVADYEAPPMCPPSHRIDLDRMRG
jgi:ABC-type Mn2+/Zn2+ transport system ATPase subunit